MEEKELPYFTVTDGRDLIDENQSEGSVDKATELLTILFEEIEDSCVHISLCNKTKKERAKGGKDYVYFQYKVRLRAKEESIGGINGTVLSLLEKNNELTRQLLLQGKERELEDLKREIKELKEGKEDDISPMEKMAMQALGSLISHNKQQGVGIAGANDEPIETSKVNAQQRVRAALKRLAAVDNDLPGSLELLADFIEKKPEQLPIIKAMLKGA